MIANNNTPKWYPPKDPAISKGTADALKLMFDNVYALRDGQAEIAANINSITSNVSNLSGIVASLPASSGNANITPSNNGTGPVITSGVTFEVNGALSSINLAKVQNLIPGNNITITDGGNGNITFAASANGNGGFSNPMTTLGDIITGNNNGVAQRLGVGSNNQILTVVAGIPSWNNATVNSPILPQPPSLNSWTQVNYGNSTSDGNFGNIYLQAPASASFSLRMLVQSLNSSPYTLSTTFRQMFPVQQSASYAAGIVLRDSVSGKIILYYISTFGAGSTFQIGVNRYNNATSFNATAWSDNYNWPGFVSNISFRIQESNSNRFYQWSNDDGAHWFTYNSAESPSTFLTPNQVGICADSENVNSPAAITLTGWNLTYP